MTNVCDKHVIHVTQVVGPAPRGQGGAGHQGAALHCGAQGQGARGAGHAGGAGKADSGVKYFRFFRVLGVFRRVLGFVGSYRS